jgi:hypothetical protein
LLLTFFFLILEKIYVKRRLGVKRPDIVSISAPFSKIIVVANICGRLIKFWKGKEEDRALVRNTGETDLAAQTFHQFGRNIKAQAKTGDAVTLLLRATRTRISSARLSVPAARRSDVDLSFYEGTGTGPDMEKIKAAALGNITLKNNQG